MRKQKPSQALVHAVSALSTAILLVALLSSCKKSVSSPPSFTKGVNVYMAGQDSAHAAYWKNGQKVDLSDSGGIASKAIGIAISGSDVYVAGEIFKGSEQYAVYWKDGALFYLTNTGISNINQIVVSGSDVYITGDVFGVAPIVNAVYWKNGIRVDIAPSSYGQTIGMAFSGSDMYTVGEIWNIYTDGFDSAVLWKNGVLATDYYAVDAGEFVAIAFSGADMYIVGMKGYSKNEGAIIPMPDASYVSGIAFSGQDIYIAGGSAGANGQSIAAYWKNGVSTILPSHPSPSVYGIAVSGDDVYTVGSSDVNNQQCPAYWKNTTEVILGSNGSLNAVVIGN